MEKLNKNLIFKNYWQQLLILVVLILAVVVSIFLTSKNQLTHLKKKLPNLTILNEVRANNVSDWQKKFEERRESYIRRILRETEAGKYNLNARNDIDVSVVRNALWAWLETGTHYDLAIKAIKAMLGVLPLKNKPGLNDNNISWVHGKDVGLFAGVQADNAYIVKILLQYGDKLKPEDYNFIKNTYYRKVIRNSNFLMAGNPNQMILNMVGVYLYAENFGKNITFTYMNNNYMGDHWRDFSYQGREYHRGGRYNLYQFAKDWLQYRFDKWVNTYNGGNFCDYWEFDSEAYTKAFINALLTLNDFAKDKTIERKSKMALDLILYDYMADTVGGNQHGSSLGRYHFRNQIDRWLASSYEYVLFGMPVRMNEYIRQVSGYTTFYKPPLVMSDLLDLSDEPDNYWYILKEYNQRLHIPGTGKWNYVTKYFNLGGGYNHNWELNIQPCPNKGYPFRLWMNKKSPQEKGDNQYIQGGEFYQYKNAVFSPHWQKLVIINNNQRFEKDETEAGWRFLKECKTMIAFKTSNTSSAMQVEVLGSRYNSFDEFKKDILGKARLGADYFKTTYGDVIDAGRVGNFRGRVNGKPIWKFPFKRLEIEDFRNDKIISWQNNVMKVSLHGKTCTYDFNRWVYYGNGCLYFGGNGLADLNQDNKENVQDLGIVFSHWGKIDKGRYDINQDGRTDINDIIILLNSI